MLRIFSLCSLLCICPATFASNTTPHESSVTAATLPNAETLIRQALESWRGKTSFSQVRMQVQRQDWQRESVIQAWTQGMNQSLIRFVEPVKDAGNATLKLDKDMWLFSPKLNRVTKLPSSMMSQSWMGSDFSYNDLSKTDQILTDYDAKITRVLPASNAQKQAIYQLELTPKPNAPIVWGKEILWIREDGLLLQETFFDQLNRPVKILRTIQEATVNQKPYPWVMRMQKVNQTSEWTQIETQQLWFDIALPNNLFTQTYLKSPRAWQPSLESQPQIQPKDISNWSEALGENP